MATSKYFSSLCQYFHKVFLSIFRRILFIRQSSVFDQYHVDWIMNYVELEQIPVIKSDQKFIEILFNVR